MISSSEKSNCTPLVAKQLPTAVEVLRKVLYISRSTRDHVARLRIVAEKSTTKLVIPTSTRWNSQTRSAARILDFVCELQEAGVGLTVDGIVALKVFVICTAPFAWATTKSQSDHATIGSVRHLCSEIRDEFNTIKNQAKEFQSRRATCYCVCTAAGAALLTRESRYLTNTVTDALDTLESVNTLATSKWTALQKLVCSYYRTINVTREVEPEISLFLFRSDDERFRSNQEVYWNFKGQTHGLLQKFRSEMRSFLSTVACVERSFLREGVIWSAIRNRMSATSVDDQLFVALNYPKFGLKESREPQAFGYTKKTSARRALQRQAVQVPT
jgi:hypothetical protein